MAKTDIESVFRLIPVHPDRYELLGMHWNGKYYHDKVLLFGLRSAPFIFNQLSDAIEWILSYKCNISFLCHILDDFLIMEPASLGPQKEFAFQTSLNAMLLTFKNLSIPIAPGKTEGPDTVLEFMGIILDSTRMEARLPADRIDRLRTDFEFFRNRKSCTLKELQLLIGTLNFVCKVIPTGRPYLQRIIELTRNVKQPHHHIKLSSGFFKDLEMWQQSITSWNGASFFLSSEWTNSDFLEFHSDASGTLGYKESLGPNAFRASGSHTNAWENMKFLLPGRNCLPELSFRVTSN